VVIHAGTFVAREGPDFRILELLAALAVAMRDAGSGPGLVIEPFRTVLFIVARQAGVGAGRDVDGRRACASGRTAAEPARWRSWPSGPGAFLTRGHGVALETGT
jgi:hypothetical protein